METGLLSYFTDAILRGPTLGSMLMGLSSSLMGVLVYFQRRSLIGEVLSHTSYPGVILGISLSMLLFPEMEYLNAVLALGFAFIVSLIGVFGIEIVTKKGGVNEDTALCFILSSFFGIGVLGSSIIQQNFPLWFRAAQSYLFGQAATMTDLHIVVYSFFACVVIAICFVFYRYFQVHLFDPFYAKSINMGGRRFQLLFNSLVAFSVVIGIRSVGVVLMSSMLIAPAVFATALSKKFANCLLIAAIFGMIVSFFGVVFSLELPEKLGFSTMPTGPFIVVISTSLCFLSLAYASITKRKQIQPRGQL